MNRFIRILLVLCFLAVMLPQNLNAEEPAAKEISSMELVTARANMAYPSWLFNGETMGFQTSPANASITLESGEGIGSLYILFNVSHEPYTIRNNDSGQEQLCGQEDFLHDFVDVKALFGEVPHSVTISFGDKPVQLSELRVFTEGRPPEDVQRWKLAPEEGVDLLVFPTHGDDEQLFFAGLLPYYAGELGYEVQVAYSTDHHNYDTVRPHEMLNGLWAVGVTNYPVFGPFPDFLTNCENAALESIKPAGYEEEDVKAFVVEQIRRFKPLVTVGHDLHGEYGHGFHRLYGRMVKEASKITMDPAAFPESAEKYGVWDVPKTYIHLLDKNPIHMNWDIPLERFDGMTAYEVSKEIGYPAHTSQYIGFAWYFAGKETAESIDENGPCDYGLYRSTVGEDVQKNDLFENLICRREQKRLEQEAEEKRKQEEERLRQEEEQKRQEEEDRAREEAEKLEAQRIAEEKLAKEAAARKHRTMTVCGWILAGSMSLAILMILILRIFRKRK